MKIKLIIGIVLLLLYIAVWIYIWWECKNAPIVPDEDEDEETPDNAT